MTSPASPAQPISDELAQIRERDAAWLKSSVYDPADTYAGCDRTTLLAAYDHQSAEIARLRKVVDWGALEIVREAVRESNVVKRENMHQIANRMYAALTSTETQK